MHESTALFSFEYLNNEDHLKLVHNEGMKFIKYYAFIKKGLRSKRSLLFTAPHLAISIFVSNIGDKICW